VYRFIVIKNGVIAASRGGKLKTIVQSVAISLALLPFWSMFGDWVYWFDGILMTAAVILTVATGLDYLWQAWRGSRARATA
jgi:CDP-diacylglycerol---glycerol-3-phosphate 3-phosphatidyltransferase